MICKGLALNLPLLQSVHADADAELLLYVPATHPVIPIAPLPVYPASAKQSISASDAAGLLLWAGHPWQSEPVSDASTVL